MNRSTPRRARREKVTRGVARASSFQAALAVVPTVLALALLLATLALLALALDARHQPAVFIALLLLAFVKVLWRCGARGQANAFVQLY